MGTDSARGVIGVQLTSRSTSGVWRSVIGMLVVGYGAVLLLYNLGFPVHAIERAYIPFAVLILGAVKTLQAYTPRGRTIGAIVVLGAGAWTYARLVGIRVDVDFWWPIALMALGVIFLLRAREPAAGDPAAAAGTRGTIVNDAGPSQADAVAFWSGVRRRVTSAAFSRADLVAVMGGVEIDLRPATTAGGTATIEVFVLMGGIEITVPPDWAVVNRAVVVMGGVTDRSTGAQGAANTLVIQGVVLMGGVEVKT
ncbi:MAG TPA: LiaF domain-containing protein [Vicinamibacterales bacterium]